MFASISCTQGAFVRGRVDDLTKVVDEAEKNGAVKCAPRELALAKAHLRFAATELDQGQLSNAENHLAIAEPNAKAAREVSLPDKCAGREPVAGDRDGDGIPDQADQCPDEPENYNGYQDTDGCPDDPDTDGDGIPDSRDACPLEPEDKDNYLDEDGCPELDNDADGIADAKDKCPNQPEDPDGFQDEDGCPDSDNDQDTVADVEDLCPNTPGQPGGTRPGCPQLVMVTAREIRITQQIQFEFNKATIRPVSFPILDAVVDVLKANPGIKLEVQGHTDNVGNAQYNQRLSQSRADSCKNYLVAHGIEASRLTSKGYGMTQPIVPNNSEANRALNRRVQFIRTEGKPGP
jgi:outer membrane protein OmpA-like peptidoglycan-associated protein